MVDLATMSLKKCLTPKTDTAPICLCWEVQETLTFITPDPSTLLDTQEMILSRCSEHWSALKLRQRESDKDSTQDLYLTELKHSLHLIDRINHLWLMRTLLIYLL